MVSLGPGLHHSQHSDSFDASSATLGGGVDLQVVARLRRVEGAFEHVCEHPASAAHVVTARGGLRRELGFSQVVGPDASPAEFHARVTRPACHKALATRGEHAAIFVYGLSTSGRKELLVGDAAAALPAVAHELAHEPDVAVQAHLLRGEQSLSSIAPASVDGAAPLGRRAVAALSAAVSKAAELGTVAVTFTLRRGGAPFSRVSLVLFEAAEQLTPQTRKHAMAVCDMLRVLGDERGCTASALRLAARKSRLTQLLRASAPAALAPGSSVVFVAASQLHLDEAGENALRLAADLLHAVGGPQPQPPARTLQGPVEDHPHPQHQQQQQQHSECALSEASTSPLPVPRPTLRWASASSAGAAGGASAAGGGGAAATASVDDCALSAVSSRASHAVESLARRGGSEGWARLAEDSVRLRDLETELLACRGELYESRQRRQQAVDEAAALRRQAADAEADRARAEQLRREAQTLREAKRRLQLRAAEGEQRRGAAEAAAAAAEAERGVLAGELEECRAALRGVEEGIQEAVAETVERELAGREEAAAAGAAGSVRRREEAVVEWRVSQKDEVEALRRHLEEAQEHVRQLSQAVVVGAGEAVGSGAAGAGAAAAEVVLARQLELRQELCRMYCAKLETYEGRIETILLGGGEDEFSGGLGGYGGDGDAAAASERVFLLETALDRAERAGRKAELDLQAARLDAQAAAARHAGDVQALRAQVEEAAAPELEPDTSVVEGYVKDKSRMVDELQRARDGEQALARRVSELEAAAAAARAEAAALRGEVQGRSAGLQRAEEAAHLNVTQLAETSVENARLRSELEPLRAEAAALRRRVEHLERQAGGAQQEADAARADAEAARAEAAEQRRAAETSEKKSEAYAEQVSGLQASYIDKTAALTERARRDAAAAAQLEVERDALAEEVALLRREASSERRLGCSLEVQRRSVAGENDALRASLAQVEQRAGGAEERLARVVAENGDIAARHGEALRALEEARERARVAEGTVEFYKQGEGLRFEEGLNAEMEQMRGAEQQARELREVQVALQVKNALVGRLEKKLAEQVSHQQQQHRLQVRAYQQETGGGGGGGGGAEGQVDS